jgi:hypothetical protein
LNTTDVVFLGLFCAILVLALAFKLRPFLLFAISFVLLFVSGILTVVDGSQWANLIAVAGFLGLFVSILTQIRTGIRTFGE